MSRLGKKPILIPEKTEAVFKEGIFSVKGPLGELSRFFKNDINIVIDNNSITLAPKKESKEAKVLWGTYVSHIKNMIEGVTKGFEKKLLIEGVGFRAQSDEKNLVLNLGLSHPVTVPAPEKIKVKVEKNIITISGINKEEVGQFSAKIRMFKKPEPYKGKGIRYENEIIRRKAGKKAVASA